MLRCPKCGRIYQNGTQRFCTFDGGRLIPVSEAAPFVPPKIISFEEAKNQQTGTPGVFAPFSEQNQPESSNRELFPPLAGQIPEVPKKRATGRLTKPEGFVELPNNSTQEPLNTPFQPPLVTEFPPASTPPEKTSGRIIKQSEVPPGHIDVNDPSRLSGKLNLNLSPETAERFIGQNVKGRYFVEHLIKQDNLGVTYSAQDRFTPGKRVVIYVFMHELRSDNAAVRSFQEEKITLSHLTTPGLTGILDSGELIDGKAFLVREYVDGKTLHTVMTDIGQFSLPRAARIIRQVAQSLSEAHNNRILHRDLRPENIVLKQMETGLEQAKVIDMGISGLRVGLLSEDENSGGLAYHSPERIIGQPLTPESDIFSLAVIAYEMLTAQKPFKYHSAMDLLEKQRDGLTLRPTNLRSDVSSVADAVLEKALSYDKTRRYQSAREFGEAFFNALSDNSQKSIPISTYPPQNVASSIPPSSFSPVSLGGTQNISPINSIPPANTPAVPQFDETVQFTAPKPPENENIMATAVNFIPPDAPKTIQPAKPLEKLPEDVKTEPANNVTVKPNVASASGRKTKSAFSLLPVLAGLFGLLIFFGIIGFGVWYALTQLDQPAQVKKVEPVKQPDSPPPVDSPSGESPPVNTAPSPSSETPETPESPVTAEPSVPAGFVAFKNDKASLLNPNLEKNAVGFSIAYPESWEKNPSIGTKKATNFLDIAKRTGKKPIEQLLISWYGSEGTFELDNQKKFKDYAPQLKGLFSRQIPKYQQVSEGPTTFNGKQAYEVKFQGEDEEVTVWGRTVFLPVGKEGAKSGLMITMLATSFDPDIQGVDDLGTKGDLAKIVETFRLEE